MIGPAGVRENQVHARYASGPVGVDRAKIFVSSSGGVTERNMAIDVSEEIARKGQEVREMTRNLDLLKVDVDTIAMVIRLRGASVPTGVQGEDATESAPDPERD